MGSTKLRMDEVMPLTPQRRREQNVRACCELMLKAPILADALVSRNSSISETAAYGHFGIKEKYLLFSEYLFRLPVVRQAHKVLYACGNRLFDHKDVRKPARPDTRHIVAFHIKDSFMIKLIDPDHPFYRPLWIRLLIIALCAVWTAVEFRNGENTWGMIFLAVTTYTACTLLIFFKPKPLASEEAKVEAAPTGPVEEIEKKADDRG
jgi:hypothetical protein